MNTKSDKYKKMIQILAKHPAITVGEMAKKL